MRPRAFPTFALCLAVLTASSLGLNRGMVLYVDHHGHVALDSAHVRHAHDHEQCANHEPHDFTGDADHDKLHAALVIDAHAGAVKAEQQSAASSPSAVAHAAVLPHPFSALLLPEPPCGIARTGPGDFRGDTAHLQLASLRAVVLLV